jgi:hypothetical protein
MIDTRQWWRIAKQEPLTRSVVFSRTSLDLLGRSIGAFLVCACDDITTLAHSRYTIKHSLCSPSLLCNECEFTVDDCCNQWSLLLQLQPKHFLSVYDIFTCKLQM